MSKEQEIKDFIWSFINPNDEECGGIEFNEENTQKLQRYIDDGLIIDTDWTSIKYKDKNKNELDAILYLAELEFGVKFQWDCIGSFDSPGYDMNDYAWACILPNGELYFDSWSKESY